MDVYKYADLLSVWWFELKKKLELAVHVEKTCISDQPAYQVQIWVLFSCNVNWEEYSV